MNVRSIYDRYKVKIEDGMIYDPIRQKLVRLTPEELVRQKTIRFLTRRLGVPEWRLVVEKGLGWFGVEGSRKRIDIGVLDEENLIMAVVECKAPPMIDSEAAYRQAGDYLLELDTRYFFVTDGLEFDGYYYDTTQFIRLEQIPKYDKWYDYPRAK